MNANVCAIDLSSPCSHDGRHPTAQRRDETNTGGSILAFTCAAIPRLESRVWFNLRTEDGFRSLAH